MTAMPQHKKTKKSPAQLAREVAEVLSRSPKTKRSTDKKHAKRARKLVVEYDVTGLSRAEVDGLTGAAVVQGEESDNFDVGHPDVAVTSRVQKRGARKFLVVEYDVADLSDAQADALAGEAEAQADGGDGGLWIEGEPTSAVYPSVSFTTKIV